jgi:MFS family permease
VWAARVRGLGPLRAPGFPAILACAAGLGLAFGAVTVTLPAYATAHGSRSGALAGVLFAVLGVGSVLGGVWFGAHPRPAPLPRQFTALLAAVAASYAVFALMPHPAALAAALFLGGAVVAPALTVESSLVGRITPAGMRTEGYTWVVTVEVAAAAVGIQASGLIVDRPGGVPWAFLPATAAVGLATVVAALPSGIARAYARAGQALPVPRWGCSPPPETGSGCAPPRTRWGCSPPPKTGSGCAPPGTTAS